MSPRDTDIFFTGEVAGEPWDARDLALGLRWGFPDAWPPAEALAVADVRRSWRRRDPHRRLTLRECLLRLLMDYGGDFVFTSITRDSVIHAGHGTRRSWPVTAFPSIADLLEQEET